MAPATVRTSAVLGLGLLLGFFCSSAFIAPPGAGQGRLRAGHVQQLSQSQPASSTASMAGSSTSGLLAACSIGSVLVAAAAAVARRAEGKELATEQIPRPEDLLESPKFPLFAGSTGGYMSRATRERHAITWTAPEMAEFEMPTGGWAVMNKGENLCYFRKKEQCIALGKQLRKRKIENYKVYRLAKDGTVKFMHPADGVFPEKVNKGRVQVNGRPFTVCQNPQQGELKWTKYHMRSYEADPLTTMFIKARMLAWTDEQNIFALPNPDLGDLMDDDEDAVQPVDMEQKYTTELMEAIKKVQEERKSL